MITDLQTKGFTVIKHFLSNEEVAGLIEQFNIAKTKEPRNKNYQVFSFNHNLYTKIEQVLEQVRNNTDLHVDLTYHIAGFFDNALLDFAWHQDHEPYYRQQDSYHGLNFWIPIIKPDPKLSGLSVVPFTSIASLPQLNQLIGSGAKIFRSEGNTTFVKEDEYGNNFIIDVDLDKVSECPELEPGDLLLLRHDVIHKTQDRYSNRVAVSIRCYNGQSVITKDKFLSGCLEKKEYIKNNIGANAAFFEKFVMQNAQSCLLSDVYDHRKNRTV